MTKDIDNMLRDLEKQVQDFSLTMTEHQVKHDNSLSQDKQRYRQLQHHNNSSSNNQKPNSDNTPLHVYTKTRNAVTKEGVGLDSDDEDEESISIGTILQRSATARRAQDHNKSSFQATTMLSHSKSFKSSTSSSSSNKTVPYHHQQHTPPVPPTQQHSNIVSKEDEELRFAMQRAWAVLDQKEDAVTPVSTSISTANDAPLAINTNTVTIPHRMVSTTGRIQTVALKSLTTEIYIEDGQTFKVVQLTNLLTTAMVIQYLKKKGLLTNHSDEWTLFEIDNSHSVERPIREWEIVLDVLRAWEPDASNALLVKKYSYHYTLTSECILQKKVAPMSGWLSIEYKKGKWQKRYCFIKDNAIYHAKDKNMNTTSSILCHLAAYDVYTLLSPLKISPTPFVFAIRAQEKSSIFEKEGDFMRLLAVEDQEQMENWVLSIRCTKSNIHYQYYPNRVINPLASISFENSSSNTAVNEEAMSTANSSNDASTIATATATSTHSPPAITSMPSIRRHKSTREYKQQSNSTSTSEEHLRHLPKSESSRKVAEEGGNSNKRILSRSATTTTATSTRRKEEEHQPLIDCQDGPFFSKGSLLAKEEEVDQILCRQLQQQQLQQQQQLHDENNKDTLIHIEDRVKFSKGSLLDKKEQQYHSNSNHELANSARRHASLRKKHSSKRQENNNNVNPPLPTLVNNNNTSITCTNNSTTTTTNNREPKGRTNVKPLLNFDLDEKRK